MGGVRLAQAVKSSMFRGELEAPDSGEGVLELELATDQLDELASPSPLPPVGAAPAGAVLVVHSPVVVTLAPPPLARRRHTLKALLPAFLCLGCAMALAVAGQWFGSVSGHMPHMGPIPLSFLILFLIGLAAVQVVAQFGRR